MFEHPTATSISEFLSSQLRETIVYHPTEMLDRAMCPVIQPPDHPDFQVAPLIGITGAVCRLAGHVKTIEQLWSSLTASHCQISLCPPQRWLSVCHGIAESVMSGGFLDDLESVEKYDVTGGDLDIHMQLLLEMIFEAVDDTGWGHHSLKLRRLCVLTAVNVYGFTVPMPPFAVAHTVANALRVDCLYNNIDAACSSSYLGLCQAVKHLNRHECGAAIVGGTQLLLQPRSFDMASGNIYSKSGVMRPFDVRAVVS